MADEIRSSSGEFKIFTESSVYTDFQNELDIRIKMLRDLMEDPDMKHTGRDYDVFRGGLKNLRQMKEIFTDLYENKKEDEERAQEKQGGNNV